MNWPSAIRWIKDGPEGYIHYLDDTVKPIRLKRAREERP
jgi:hypothetical protein